jgi:uncharacterized protein YcfL
MVSCALGYPVPLLTPNDSKMLRLIYRLFTTASLALAVTLPLGGCQSPEPVVVTAVGKEVSMEPTLEAPSQDESVAKFLVQHLRDSRMVGGLREVDLYLENQADAQVAFAYQVEWLDRQGEKIPDTEQFWIPVLLESGKRIPLSLRATHADAESWRLVAVALDSEQ